MREVDYGYALRTAWEHLRFASDDVLAEFIKELSSSPRYNLKNSFSGKVVNCDFAVDYSGQKYQMGSNFVYAWVNDKGEIFYVGRGDNVRVVAHSGRTSEFKEIYKNAYCIPILIACFINKYEAQEIEKLCIWYIALQGYELVNHQWSLSAKERRNLRKNTSPLTSEYETLTKKYKEIVEAVTKIIKYCESIEIGNSRLPSLEKIVTSKKVWTIDGVTKSTEEWCKEYHVAPSVVYKRIKNQGLTPIQALTFPTVPNGTYRRKPKQYWKELGLI